MERKICSKCLIDKELCEFGKNRNYPDGLSYHCKECRKNETKKYREKNHDKILKSSSDFKKNNQDKVKEGKKKYYLKHYDKINEKNKNYQLNNRDKILEYRQKNRAKHIQQSIEWRRNNVERKRESEREYYKKNYRSNVIYKLSKNVRTRICEFIKVKKINKNNTTFNLVGCSSEELKLHLERQFTIGMSWDNHGVFGWHIDHIIPLNSADIEDELFKLCHYTNLQPLWAPENLSKGDKILTPLPNNSLHVI
jgi:hypothetical protein